MTRLIVYQRLLKDDLEFLKRDVSLKREGSIVLISAASVEIAGIVIPNFIAKQFIGGVPLYLTTAASAIISAIIAAKTFLVLCDKLTIPKYHEFQAKKQLVEQELIILIKELEIVFKINTNLELLEQAEIKVNGLKLNDASVNDYDITIEDINGQFHTITQRMLSERGEKSFVETFQRGRKNNDKF